MQAQKELVNPRMHVVLVLQKWNNITKQLLKFTYTKMLKNKKMCKDKWNGLNSNYKKLLNYHRGAHNFGN
jgi:hypothetical protein